MPRLIGIHLCTDCNHRGHSTVEMNLRALLPDFLATVGNFEQSVSPFDILQIFASEEVSTCEVTLIPVDDAKEAPASFAVQATELRCPARLRVTAARHRLDKRAIYRSAGPSRRTQFPLA